MAARPAAQSGQPAAQRLAIEIAEALARAEARRDYDARLAEAARGPHSHGGAKPKGS